ncbi:MAG TPA: PAS domain S-box protein, partial [Chroococcales cyanobacterium]
MSVKGKKAAAPELLKRIEQLEKRLSDMQKLERAELEELGSGPDEESPGLLDFSSVGICRCDVHGRVFEPNDNYCKMVGYSREDLVSGRVLWPDFSPREWRHADERAIAEIKRCGKATPFEKEFIHKDGHRVPVLIAVDAKDTSGNDCYCFVLDLTEQKEKEAALRRSEQEFRLLADAIPQIVFITGVDSQVDYWNKRFWEETGITPTDYGEVWRLALHPDDIDYATDAWNIAVTREETYEVQLRQKNAEGEYRWILVRAVPLHNEHGASNKWLGTSTDTDQQVKAVKALKESEERFRRLADGIPQIVWTANAAGQIDFFNHRFFEYSGLTAEQSLDGGWQLL